MIEQLLAAIVTQLQEQNKSKQWKLKKVDEHAGSFTWKEFEEKTYSAPAVFVSCLGWRELGDNEESRSPSMGDIYAARFALALITEHSGSLEKQNKQARQLAQKIGKFIKGSCFGFNEVSGAYQIKVDPVFSGAINESGQSLWLIYFWHHLPMDADSPLEDFEGLEGQHKNPENSSQLMAETHIDFNSEE